MILNPWIRGAWLLLLCAVSAQAFELLARVEYVAVDVVFIDKGSEDGLRLGDMGRAMPMGQNSQALEVVHVSSNRASLRIPEDSVGLEEGVMVRFELPEERLIKEVAPAEPVDTLIAEVAPTRKRRALRDRSNRLRGFISVERFQESGEFDSWDQSLRGSLRSDRLMGLPIDFRSRFRLRQEEDAGGARRWTSRIPQLEFAWQSPGSPLELRAGRLAGAGLGRAGSLDGVEVGTRDAAGQRWQGWAGLGTDPSNDRPDATLQKLGLAWRRQDKALGGELTSGLALAGSYREGETEREFVAQQFSLTLPLTPGRLSLGQESELDFNRGWRSEKQNSIALNRFDLRARQQFGRAFSINAGWRRQRSPLTLEQKDLADSLVALHESGSLSLGGDWRVTRPFSIYADVSRLQDRAGLKEGRSMRIGLRHTGLPLAISGGLTGHLYHNSVSDSRQFQLDLVRSFARSTRVSLRAGQQTLDNGG
ncbi:MAG: hypothetical protein KDC10_14330, partial [Calditrichaeota bacterium]|nr:hypothetical protein [Calditrichota bacterium]